jgi:hypothetical protein
VAEETLRKGASILYSLRFLFAAGCCAPGAVDGSPRWARCVYTTISFPSLTGGQDTGTDGFWLHGY